MFLSGIVQIIIVSHKLMWNILFMKGFDEYMNLVLDDAEEVHLKTKKRRPLGNITSIKLKPKPFFLA